MIADWCRELAGFPESVWIAYAQSREPLRRLVTSEDYANHFHAASFCGVEMARQVRGDWGDISCRELAEKLNVKLEWPAMPDGVGMLTFACYFEPDRILVYTDNAAATRSLIQESGGVEFLGDVDIGEMLLAHELCHVLQTVGIAKVMPQSHRKQRQFQTASAAPAVFHLGIAFYIRNVCHFLLLLGILVLI